MVSKILFLTNQKYNKNNWQDYSIFSSKNLMFFETLRNDDQGLVYEA